MPEVPKRNLPLIVAAQIEASTVNTKILTSYLPLEMTRSDLREQWLRRQLSSKSLDSDRFAVLTIALRIGERALPLIRTAESGAANIAYALKAIFSLTLAKEICSLPVPSHRVIKNATRPMCHYSKARL
nr:MAG: hypothetical protein BECKH772B_GA0070898_100855 [Candidatus Kentron sp. H]VFK02902.1 MAG: hypothetical protein BECKH772C_GA0070978_101074 [Candidatus Kentron sp. H]